MRASLAAGFRQLVSKIHPPLPRTPRETQQLLDALTGSFRQQLDKQHTTTAAHPTNVHIQSILSSPLFAPRRGLVGSAARAGRHSQASVTAMALEELQDSLFRPLEYFQEQVGAGLATLETAKHCLDAHTENLSTYRDDPSDVPGGSADGVQQLGAAAMILNWLWSSGLEESCDFLRDIHFIKLLLPLLVAERQEGRMWLWLERIQLKLRESVSKRTVPDWDLLNAGGYALRRLVHSHIKVDNDSVGAGLQTFVKASRRLQIDSPRIWPILKPAGKMLFFRLTNETNYDVNVADYDSMLKTVSLWTPNALYCQARMALFHPTSADAGRSLQFLKTRVEAVLEQYDVTRRRATIRLCLDTATFLLARKEFREANWVLTFLQDHFPDEIRGDGETLNQDSGKVSVDMLNTLAAG